MEEKASPPKFGGAARIGRRGTEGRSLGLTLPRMPLDIAGFLGVGAGDVVVFFVDESKGQVVLVNPKRERWLRGNEEFALGARATFHVQEDEP